MLLFYYFTLFSKTYSSFFFTYLFFVRFTHMLSYLYAHDEIDTRAFSDYFVLTVFINDIKLNRILIRSDMDII